MAKLPSLICPTCKQTIVSDEYPAKSKPKAPSSYKKCLRRCERCGYGFSNANVNQVEKLTIIYRDPFRDLPREIAEGHELALAQALNRKNRVSKRAKFASLKSEDHVTWTIFRYLQMQGALRSSLAELGPAWLAQVTSEPTLLLWGTPVPVDDVVGQRVRQDLIDILTHLGENPDRCSEPDVILSFGRAGVVFIEVKLTSPNDQNSANERWDKYMREPSGASRPSGNPFADVDNVKKSGLYELMRNWRIAWELSQDRPMALVNLGPDSLFSNGQPKAALDLFSRALTQSDTRRFIPLSWNTLLSTVRDRPSWLQRYIGERVERL